MTRRIFAAAMLVAGSLIYPTSSAHSATPSGRTFYVSPKGADGGTGTRENPWRTLTKALPSLRPGDTLYVRGGTYPERIRGVAIQPATREKPITVAAFPGERPVLKGLLRLERPSYWTIDGLNVTWDDETGEAREHMVKIGNGVGWTFKNAEVWGARSFAAVLVYTTREGEPRDWRIAECTIRDTHPANKTNRDHLIYVNSGLTGGNGVIERNVLYNATNGTGIKLGGPSASAPGVAGVTIRHNTIFNCAQGVLVAWSSRNNQIYGNLIGGVRGNYGAIRGYELEGANNVARDNYAFAAKSVFLNDSGYAGVRDGGGNRLGADPRFEAATFRPGHPVVAPYGRFAS